MNELKPCPFCGKKTIVAKYISVYLAELSQECKVGIVACYNCGGQVRAPNDLDWAKKVWNERAK